jgi:hypothetical protein
MRALRIFTFAVLSGMLWCAPANATEIAFLTNVTSTDAPIGGYYTATSTKTEFTFTINNPDSENDLRLDYMLILPQGGDPYTDNLLLGLVGGCTGYECVGPLDAIVPTMPGVTYDIGATIIAVIYDPPANNSVRIDAIAIGGAPEPSVWIAMLAGFALAGYTIRQRKPASSA